MFARCRFLIPQTTWAYVAILTVVVVGAIMREINLLIILAGLMAGPLLMSWQLIRLTLRDLTVERRLPRGVFPGQSFVVELTVRNRRKRLDTWALVVEDRLRNVLTRGGAVTKTARCLLPHIAAGSTSSASYRAQLNERGRYRLGPLRLSTKVPVGLLQGFVTLKETNDVLVYPRIGRLKLEWSELMKHEQMGQRRTRQSQGPVEGDYYGLRDWRAGDSRRWIHWRSSAKRQELVVRQFEQRHSQDLTLLLDLFIDPDAVPVKTDDVHVEKAISFVATLVTEYCRQGGGRLTLGIAGVKPRLLRGTASSALQTDALELLAEATASRVDTLAEVMSEAFTRSTSGDRIVVISTWNSDLLSTDRLSKVGDGSSGLAQLQRTVGVDVSQPGFDALFDADDASTPALSEAV